MKNLGTLVLGTCVLVALCAFKVEVPTAKVAAPPVAANASAKAKAAAEKTKADAAKKATTAKASAKTAVATDPVPSGGLCDASASVGLCYLFAGKGTSDAKSQNGNKTACKLMQGEFKTTGSCPAEKRTGTCTIKPGTPEEYVLVYYSGKTFDTAKAASDCADAKSTVHQQGAGKWTPAD